MSENVNAEVIARTPAAVTGLPNVASLPNKLHRLTTPVPMDLVERTLIAIAGTSTLLHLLSATLILGETSSELASGTAQIMSTLGVPIAEKSFVTPFSSDGRIALLDSPIVRDITSALSGSIPNAGRIGFRFTSVTPSGIISQPSLELVFKLYNLDTSPENV